MADIQTLIASLFQKQPEPIEPTSEPEPSEPVIHDLRKPQGKSRYIYNPGLDIEGIEDLTNSQHRVIKGGVITRLDSQVRWVCEGTLPEGGVEFERYDKVRKWVYIEDSDEMEEVEYSFLQAQGYTIGPDLVARGLVNMRNGIGETGIAILLEWNDLDIDLVRLNENLQADTWQKRWDRLQRLPSHPALDIPVYNRLLNALNGFKEAGDGILNGRYQELQLTRSLDAMLRGMDTPIVATYEPSVDLYSTKLRKLLENFNMPEIPDPPPSDVQERMRQQFKEKDKHRKDQRIRRSETDSSLSITESLRRIHERLNKAGISFVKKEEDDNIEGA